MKKNEENTKTKNKPLSPIKLTPTSVLDYFGTESVQRSAKKMVASKRKEVGILPISESVRIGRRVACTWGREARRALVEVSLG